VGQAPARAGGPAFGRGTRSGDRLARIVGARGVDEFADAVNLVGRWPGKRGKGDRFPVREARTAADGVDLSGRPFVVLVGCGPARVFGWAGGYFEWFLVRGVPAVMVPHPSGVNHWWNLGKNRRAAARFLRGLCGGARRRRREGGNRAEDDAQA